MKKNIILFLILISLGLCFSLVFYVIMAPNSHKERIKEFYKEYPDSVKFLTIDGDTATYFNHHVIKVKKTNKK